MNLTRGGEIAGSPALYWVCGRMTKSGTGRSAGRDSGESAGAALIVSNQRWLQRTHWTVRPVGPMATGSTAYRAPHWGQVTCMMSGEFPTRCACGRTLGH